PAAKNAAIIDPADVPATRSRVSCRSRMLSKAPMKAYAFTPPPENTPSIFMSSPPRRLFNIFKRINKMYNSLYCVIRRVHCKVAVTSDLAMHLYYAVEYLVTRQSVDDLH